MLGIPMHPRDRTLSDFADHELSPPATRRVAAHLAACERCRAYVSSVRDLSSAAAEMVVPELDPRVRERVLARHAASEAVIVPAEATPRVRRSAGRTAALSAAATVLVALGLSVLLGTPQAVGEASELTLTPPAPRAGDRVHVEYRATARLSGHDRLILRARVRHPSTAMAVGHTVLDTLERRGDVYTGSFVLPDSTVYAVLAVEDGAAAEVDHNGEQWEVLLHDAAGRPLYDALDQKFMDAQMRNELITREVAEQMVAMYPGRVGSWFKQYMVQSAGVDRTQLDALRVQHRQQLRSMLDAALAGDFDQIVDVPYYAGAIGDTASLRRAREVLDARFPQAEVTVQQHVFMIAEAGHDRAAFWQELERVWEQIPAGAKYQQAAFTGTMTAQQWGDTAALRLWGRRRAISLADSAAVAYEFLTVPALRAEGIAMLQAYLAGTEHPADQNRWLTHSADVARMYRHRNRGQTLGMLGRALAEEGRHAESERYMARAVDMTWDTNVFRSVANARLRSGDTAAALPLLARIAVDPHTPAAFTDSLAALVPEAGRRAELEAAARQTLERFITMTITNRAVRGRPRLAGSDGSVVTFHAGNDRPTVVAVWSRYCPPSAMQLGQLAKLGDQLQQRGIRVVTVTEEKPSPELDGFLRARKFDLPVLHDVNMEGRRAWDSMGTPVYLVLDRDGRIRFESHSLDDVLRQAMYLDRAGAPARP